MKWILLLLPLTLTACSFSFNDPDEVAYKSVIVTPPDTRVNWFGDQPKLDVTCKTVRFY